MAKPSTFDRVDGPRTRRRPIALSWDRSAADIAMRKTGISLLAEVPWGTHICLFYDTKRDLLDANVAFFKAGIESREYCFWAISDPISIGEAMDALRKGVPDFDRHLAAGDIAVESADGLYLSNGQVEIGQIIQGWHRKLHGALATGHDGLRVSGNAFWQHTEFWNAFCKYERTLDSSVAGHQILILCTYSLGATRARDLLDVARAHQCTIARRNGEWEFLQVPAVDKAKTEIRMLNGDLGILSRPFPGRELLTPREKVVLSQIVRGASNKKAARALGISPRTVEFHRANTMQKLGAKNIAELVRRVLE